MTPAKPYIPRPGERSPSAASFPHSRKRQLQIWWRELDRGLLFLVLALMAFGAVAVAAASPASARRLSTGQTDLGDLYFFWLHLRFQFLGLLVLLGTSLMPRELMRRGAIVLTAAMIGALLLVPLIGTEVNGARRWLDIGMRFQPSEFLKPAFAVTTAWILSWRARDPELPVIPLSGVLLGLVVVLLMVQPNLGDAILFVGVWFVLVVLAGLPLQRVGILAGAGLGLLICGVVVLLYLAILGRVLYRLIDEDNLFVLLAATGMAALFGGQAFVNILVNLQLFPSKGLTLPLVSYGGSSTIAQCFMIGLLLAITRRNPYLSRERLDWRRPKRGGER